MHDPNMFPSPDTFRPERFLETTEPRMRGVEFDLPFGFGRRICVGMHLAHNSLFMCVARMLWAFSILPALDARGHPIIPDRWAFTDRFNSRPESFVCRLEVRNEKIKVLVEQEWDSAKELLGKWC